MINYFLLLPNNVKHLTIFQTPVKPCSLSNPNIPAPLQNNPLKSHKGK